MEQSTKELLTISEIKLTAVLSKIRKLSPENSYTQLVAKSFHLGMVGGSGRHICRLNKRRESEIDKSVKNASELVTLYKERDHLTDLINLINSGEYEQNIKNRESNKAFKNEQLVKYWNNLKVGDTIDLGNGKWPITKKNKKSLETESGCKWTAYEIIGKEAANIL